MKLHVLPALPFPFGRESPFLIQQTDRDPSPIQMDARVPKHVELFHCTAIFLLGDCRNPLKVHRFSESQFALNSRFFNVLLRTSHSLHKIT